MTVKPFDVICLFGSLGAGKTVFVQGICKGLAVKDFVNSPSFKIVNEYRGKFPVYPEPRQKPRFSKTGMGKRQKFTRCGVYHIDLYRLNSAGEINDLGLDEYIYGNGIAIIEWAEKLGKKNLPKKRIEIYIKIKSENEREIKWRRYP
ncbi:MAG: tRNA (adenosine(37)-N6)-threonylcarbamoyltransferase complex ATPase subunit type 1 TsaE [Elusimicrobia bacterium]|nr:tRNA (adenosine(37)-N6)-threonylcarbamoyltransferase complex ATPase subunit type 1 TsaE [Elusimicrobiota bacterium]